MTALERFEDKYSPEPNSGLWLGGDTLCGYGVFMDEDKLGGMYFECLNCN
jgi:hypothetical protein